jgi:UDP-glucuronate 4-epimerase
VEILVTGAAGFIGMHVALALLARGETVIGIDNFNAYYPPQLKHDRVAHIVAQHPGFTCIDGDFAVEGALDALLERRPIDRVVHLGAQAGVRHSLDAPFDYTRANVTGHLALLEYARGHGIRHMVYASSSSVYGGNTKLPFAVGDPVDRPVSLYAATKRADELMSETYAHLFGLALTGLRFFTVYGPWGRPDMAPWLFTDAILAGRALRLNNGGAMARDFTYIDDIVAGVIAALDRPPASDGSAKPGGSVAAHALYNLGNSQSEPLTRLLQLIEAACGRAAIVTNAPIPPGDVQTTFADIGPTTRDLGYAPQTGLDIGIARFVDWFRRYHRC